MPAVKGTYLFGDFCSGEVFALVKGSPVFVIETRFSISSFGQDDSGELYVVSHGGAIYRLVPGSRVGL